jgi:hypothetical protein
MINICDCGGELKTTGIAFATYPSIVQYKCIKCGKIEEIGGFNYNSNSNNNTWTYKDNLVYSVC